MIEALILVGLLLAFVTVPVLWVVRSEFRKLRAQLRAYVTELKARRGDG